MEVLFRTKSVGQILSEPPEEGGGLKRVLGAKDLVALGIGAIIGAGIFATTGTAAAGGDHHLGAGPAVVISYMLVAIACGFCALCYAEFASLIPIAGSAYTYAYATLGELAAWIIGWDLILEYAVGNVAVAISWADYFKSMMREFGVNLSDSWTTATAMAASKNLGFAVNLPALCIVLFMTVLLVRGVKESVNFNNFVVVIKLLVLALFLAIGVLYVDVANWGDFSPNGWQGIHGAAAVIFFAYIGFDAVSTAAEETENPSRNLPIGMIGSLIICTILYIAISLVMTGLSSYKLLGTADPMATALQQVELRPGLSAFDLQLLKAAKLVVTTGAVFSLTAVLLVFQMGQPRIFFSMARDGLLPKFFAAVHPVYATPHVTTILTGLAVGGAAAFMDIAAVIELCNIGTLFAFAIVCASVLLLRYREASQQQGPPAYTRGALGTLALGLLLMVWAAKTGSAGDRLTGLVCAPFAFWSGFYYLKLPKAPDRPFTVPLAPLLPMLGVVTCIWLMMGSPWVTWIRFFAWLALGLVIYFCYGMHNSVLGKVTPTSSDIGFHKHTE
jgi:APA family basic amino acid/polyamine antiporter